MNLLTIRNDNLHYVVQNERYASSGVSVLNSFARVSIVYLNSPFLQSHRQRKMAFFPLNISQELLGLGS